MYTILQLLFEIAFRKLTLWMAGRTRRFSGFPPILIDSVMPAFGNAKIHYHVANLSGGRSIEGKGYLLDMVEILTCSYDVNAYTPSKLGDDQSYDHVCTNIDHEMQEMMDRNMMEHILRTKTVSDIIQSLGNNLAYNKQFPGIENIRLLAAVKFRENMDEALDGEEANPTRESFTDFVEKTMFRFEEQILISAICKCYPYMVNYISEITAISISLASMMLSILCCIPVTWQLAKILLQWNPYTLAGTFVLFIWVFSIVFGIGITINSIRYVTKTRKYPKEYVARRSCIDFTDGVGHKYRVFFTLF